MILDGLGYNSRRKGLAPGQFWMDPCLPLRAFFPSESPAQHIGLRLDGNVPATSCHRCSCDIWLCAQVCLTLTQNEEHI